MNWLFRWFGSGTADDWRNPMWRWTEAHKIEVRSRAYLYDWRFGFRSKEGKWLWKFSRNCEDPSVKVWTAGRDSNFYNAIFSVNRVRIGAAQNKIYHRFNLASRFSRNYFFEFGFGYLPDRGEYGWTGPWIYGYKSQSEHNPGVIARGWEEGGI
jgi:hypothetical protein